MLVTHYRLWSLFQADFPHDMGRYWWTLVFWSRALHHSNPSGGKCTNSESPALDSFSPLHFIFSVLLKGQGCLFTLSPVLSSGCCWGSGAFLSYLRGFLPPSRALSKLSLPEGYAGWPKETQLDGCSQMETLKSCFMKSVIKYIHSIIATEIDLRSPSFSISNTWPSNTIFEKINHALCRCKVHVVLLVHLKILHIWVIENS